MPTSTKATKTFSLDKSILAEVKRTKGSRSESERVNSLLKVALDLEKKAALYQEAESFFSNVPEDRDERRAFESAGLNSWTRE
jgi:hypothetical protein